MEKEKMLVSKSETIGVPQIRQLMDLGATIAPALTHDEFIAIVNIYHRAISRLLVENGESVESINFEEQEQGE